jgi:hypothetical protein
MNNVILENAGYTDSTIQSVMERYMSEEKKPKWITLQAAANHPDSKVTSRQAIWNMIQRGDVPNDCLDKRPYGKRTIYYIDANCLSELEYREHGQRGKAKDN